MNKSTQKLSLCLSVLLVINSVSLVMAAQNVPSNLSPAAINQSLTNDLLKNDKDKKLNLKKDKKDKIKQKNQQKDLNVKKEDSANNPLFKLTEVVLEGNTVYSNKELQKFSEGIIGQNVNVDDVVDIAIKITDYYKNNGYLTTQAFIPPQKIVNGKVEIRINEGKVGQVAVEGNKWTKTSYLKNKVLRANDFSQDKVFNVSNLRGSLKDLNKKDYIKGEVILEEGSKPNLTDIVLKVEDRYPLNFNVTWDGEGRELVGKHRALFMLEQNNLSGYGDRIYGGAALSSSTVGALGGYSIPVGKYGTELKFDYSYSNVRLGKEYKADHVKGTAHNYKIGVAQPIYNKENCKVTTDLSFDFGQFVTDVGDITDFSEYSTRVLRAGISAVKDDSQGRWIARGETSNGFNCMGASNQGGVNSPDNSFYKLNADVIRLNKLPLQSLGVLKLSAQYSPDRLFASEQMQLGGASSIRGYEEGLILGDSAFYGSEEVRRKIPYLKALLPKKLEGLDDKLQVCAFHDWGFIDTRHTHDLYTDSFLQSIGVGISMNLFRSLTASLDLGIPIGKQRFDSQDARLHFRISSDVHNLFIKEKQESL